jgi:hypothetical protein
MAPPGSESNRSGHITAGIPFLAWDNLDVALQAQRPQSRPQLVDLLLRDAAGGLDEDLERDPKAALGGEAGEDLGVGAC